MFSSVLPSTAVQLDLVTAEILHECYGKQVFVFLFWSLTEQVHVLSVPVLFPAEKSSIHTTAFCTEHSSLHCVQKSQRASDCLHG